MTRTSRKGTWIILSWSGDQGFSSLGCLVLKPKSYLDQKYKKVTLINDLNYSWLSMVLYMKFYSPLLIQSTHCNQITLHSEDKWYRNVHHRIKWNCPKLAIHFTINGYSRNLRRCVQNTWKEYFETKNNKWDNWWIEVIPL